MKQLLALLLFAGAALAQSAQHSVTLTWVDPNNPAGTQYNVWRATGACGTATVTPPPGYTLLNASPLSVDTYVDTAVTATDTYCYVLTAVATGGQSVPSQPGAQAVIPAAFPVSSVTAVAK